MAGMVEQGQNFRRRYLQSVDPKDKFKLPGSSEHNHVPAPVGLIDAQVKIKKEIKKPSTRIGVDQRIDRGVPFKLPKLS